MIVFMGTPAFAKPILEMLIEKKYPVGLVVTQPDKVVGRKKELEMSEVKKVALEHGIEVFQPIKIKDSYQYILDKKPKLLITAAYGQILPKALLEQVKAINVHGSLLPKYRGGAPIQYALFNGETKTGITLMEMVYKMDAGDMIEQVIVDIDPKDNYGTLSAKLSIAGRDLLEKRIDDILNGTYEKIQQDESQVTFAYTLKFEDERLKFFESSEWNINRLRGLMPNIGAHFMIDNTLVKVFDMEESDIISLRPGEIKVNRKEIFIGTKTKTLKLLEIQQESKKRMFVKDYLNGQNLFKDGGFIHE
ncbi:methionyl-tRNA formyltransferase [Acholeplasma equifetale]|uniref:methionyl-tRNA formyltransferase n=1 Tax=Acholeplasma equifetale TaxID=264634 RepID=UPI00054CF613|nr:methionyl-tRNA formyltransferase [Acholeplasma equifetale]